VRSLVMRALEGFIKRDAIGLCYHTVSAQLLAHVEGLYRAKSVGQFRCDLEYLGRHYRVVGYDDLEKLRNDGGRGRPCVVLTFDDGLAECHDVIRPVLLEYGFPAIFFVTAEFLDNRRLFYRQKVALCIGAYTSLSVAGAAVARREIGSIFGSPVNSSSELVARLKSATWNEEPAIDATCDCLGVDSAQYLRAVRPYLTSTQVRALAANGFVIGAHGLSHQALGMMRANEAATEIVASCDAVANLVSSARIPFAFPFNGRGVSRDTMCTLRASHPQIGLFFDSTELAPDREFVVNRLVVDNPTGATSERSNLPSRLRRAYLRELVRPFVRRHLGSRSS
jgi:peptidoglycan/xylan/chitin deacetylase (PgdA/CDA1 family)